MTDPDRSRRLRELFDTGRQLPLGEQPAFCRECCGDDSLLCDELGSLLAANHASAVSVLDTPLLAKAIAVGGSDDLGDTADIVAAPEKVGPFRLLEPLGEGGMGIVYRAEQTQPVRRDVAVKLIAPGMQSLRVIARFEAERQALARMNHPGIAEIHEAGTTADGRPWFAMELVHGEPLIRWCDARRLSVRARVALFRRVCDAVQHAHHKGVIHRDLKPSNVLVTTVDGEARPKIIDFGIARAVEEPLTDEGGLTRAHEIVGTPSYMSPEHLRRSADVDSRTDVYSLGVMLYELLAGELPFPDAGAHAADPDRLPEPPSTRLRRSTVLMRIAADRALGGHALRQTLRLDLDWITLRALAPEPTRRYATAAELGADLQRYLDHEPVLAGPPGLAYRLKKTARRHVVVLSAAVLVVLSLVTGVIVATDYAMVAREQAATAKSQQAALLDGLARAQIEASLRGVVQANRRELIDLRRGILEAASPGYSAKHAAIARTWIVSQDSYLQGLRDLAALVESVVAGGDEIVEAAKASLLLGIGTRALEAGQAADADAFLEHSKTLSEGRAAFDPTLVCARAYWLESLLELGRGREVEDKATQWIDEGERMFRSPRDLYMAVYRSLRGSAAVQLGHLEPAERDLRQALDVIAELAPGSHHHLGALGGAVELDEARRFPALAQQSRDLLCARIARHRRGSEVQCRTAIGPGREMLWQALGSVRAQVERKDGDLAAAVDELEQAVAASGVDGTPAGRVLGFLLERSANSAGNVHGWNENDTRRLAELAERLLRPAQPDNPAFDTSFAYDGALTNLALATSDPAVLEPLARRLARRVPSDQEIGKTMYWLAQSMIGRCEFLRGQEDSGQRRMLQAVRELVEALGVDDGNVGTSIRNALTTWREGGRLDGSVASLRAAGLLEHARNRTRVADWFRKQGIPELAGEALAGQQENEDMHR